MTSPARPHPPVDPDADLTSFRDMPLEVVRFAKSDLVAFASAEAIVAAIMLWGSSWHSRPAGSLTNDDRSLMRAAGFGRGAEAAWEAVKADALRGWYEASDGRLYHDVVAEKVRTSWKSRLKQRHQNYLTAIRMHNKRHSDDQREAVGFDAWLALGKPSDVQGSAPRPVQSEMDLDADLLRRTGAPVTHNSGPSSHEQAPQGKGIKEKGRDLESYPTTPESRANASEGAIGEEKADLHALAARFCTLGGVAFSSPTKMAEAVDLVKAWLETGIPVDRIESAISHALANTSQDRIGSLRFYDSSVRMAHAKQQPKAKRSAPKAPAPLPPWEQSDDPAAKPLREALATILGGRAATSWASPEKVALGVNGKAVTLICRSSFERQWLEANAVEHIRRALPAILGPEFTQVRTELRP